VTSRRPFVVLSLDAPAEPVLAALGADRLVLLGDHATPRGLADAVAAERADVLWLPAWCVPGPEAAADVTEWRARAAACATACAARAPLLLHCGDATTVRITPALVLSSPGAAQPFGEEPRLGQDVAVETLAAPWDVRLPEDLTSHLEAVNRQSSVAARLRHTAGRRPAWRDFTVAPVGKALRGAVAITGSRRVALPRVVLEAYREVLVTAKLWELVHGAAVA
jgi:hypothetical protein